MSTKILVAPNAGESIANQGGAPTPRMHRWMDEIGKRANADLSLAGRIAALEPTRKTITVVDSPYQIVSGDVLKIDKSGGDISVLVPASGWFKFSIESDSNTLTVDGPVNGETDIEFYFDGTGRQAEFIDDWRWI